MQDFESVTSETSVQPKELSELIARLTNPRQTHQTGGVTIKDIAETMDLNEEEVIQELVRLREQKNTQPMPEQAEKLVAALDEFKTTDFRPVNNRPLKRMTAASVILICALLFGIFFMATRFLAQPSGPLPVLVKQSRTDKPLPDQMPEPDFTKRR